MKQTRETPDERSGKSGDEEDRILLRRVAAGDRDALRKLYTKYYDPLMRFIYRVTGRVDLAQEGVNDVMLVVWQKGRSFGGKSRVSTWIMGIAYRKGLKLAERSRRWYARFLAVDLDAANEPFASAAEHTPDVDLRDLLEHGMQRLSPKQRAVLELSYYYGYSYEEIASITECPVNTVKTRMFHARAKLKELLPELANGETSHDDAD